MRNILILFLLVETRSSEIIGDEDVIIVEDYDDWSDANVTISSLCLVEKLLETKEAKYLVNCANRNITDTRDIKLNNSNVSSILNLSQNLLTRIPDLNSSTIVDLDCSYNSIALDNPGGLRQLLPSLSRLDLSHNKIGNISVSSFRPLNDSLVDIPPLANLDLSFNDLTFLPEFLFESLENLERLDLSSNPSLGELRAATTAALSSLKSLKTLRLRGCGLSIVPASLMSNLGNLQTLDISDNYFHRVDPGLRYALSLETLVLDNNLIDILDHSSFQGMKGLKNLSLREAFKMRGFNITIADIDVLIIILHHYSIKLA